MAKFKDTTSNKEFQFSTQATLSASVAATGFVDGKRGEFVGVDKIPFRLKQGDQSFYFDISKVETSSIIRLDDGTVYVPYKKSNWQDMLIGANSHIKNNFQNSSYLQISSAFAERFTQISGEAIITQLVEDNYTATAKAFVGPVTASYELRAANGVSQSYSGIDEGSGVDFLIENNSTFSTHTIFQVGLPLNEVTQSVFLTSSLINCHHSGSNTASFMGTNNTFSTPVSGTIIGKGIVTNINNSNGNQGTYASYAFKMKMAGDADSGSLYSFAQSREIIVYDKSHERFGVSSGSFQYDPLSRHTATGSGVFKTLYYHTGNVGSSTAGPSGSYTGSLSTSNPLSSPLHGDADLRTTASYGFYNTPGTTEVYVVDAPNNSAIIPRFTDFSIL